jgi:dynamin 1-like protein
MSRVADAVRWPLPSCVYVSGTDVRAYLLGERAPKLKLGYVAVVNRSQMDINENVDMGRALEAEQRWFHRKAHGGLYIDIAQTHCGTRVLAHRINGLLKSHIQKMIPSLTSNLRQQVCLPALSLASRFSATGIRCRSLRAVIGDLAWRDGSR